VVPDPDDFDRGSYHYFKAPLPPVVDGLRRPVYAGDGVFPCRTSFLVPMTGFRVREEAMLELGMTLRGLKERAAAVDQLPALELLTPAGMMLLRPHLLP
jgi:hypothetical protein